MDHTDICQIVVIVWQNVSDHAKYVISHNELVEPGCIDVLCFGQTLVCKVAEKVNHSDTWQELF